MRAVQFPRHGEPDVLEVVDVPKPHAGPGQVRVAVRAVAVNPFEVKQRRGLVGGDLPLIPGTDVSGVVDEVGAGVEDLAVGDAVFGAAAKAGYAESVVLKAWSLKPDRLRFEEAAGFVTPAETAARTLDLVGVGDGTTLVIAGASGAVGSAAVQFAVERGARVIGTASAAHREDVRALGAEPIPHDGIRAISDRVDAGIDTAGKGAVADLVALCGDPAKVVTIADFGDHEAQTSTQQSAWYALALAAELFMRGRFSLPTQWGLGFEDAAEAHRLVEHGLVRGKVILTP